MASFFDQFLGAEVELPDGMPAEQRQNALGQLYQQRRLQNAMQTLGYLGQTIMGNGGLTGQSAPRRPAPIDPRAAFVMTPQALQSYTRQQEEAYQADASRYDAQQNRAAENQRQNQILAAQERIEVKRQLQAEKDSADKFKLQKMQYDNLMADRQFREKQAADKAKAEEKEEQEKLKRGTVHTRSDGSMINIYWDGNQWNVRPVAGAPALSQGYGGGGSGGGSHGGGGGGSRGGGGGGGTKSGGYPLVGTLSDGSEVRNVSGRMTIIDPKTGAILGLYKGDAGVGGDSMNALPSRQNVVEMFFKETGTIPTQEDIDQFYAVMQEPQQEIQLQVGQSYIKDPKTGAPVPVPNGTAGSVVFREDGKLHSADAPTVPKPNGTRPPETSGNESLINSPNPHLQIREEAPTPQPQASDMNTKWAPNTVNVPFIGQVPLDENRKGIFARMKDDWNQFQKYMEEEKRKQGK